MWVTVAEYTLSRPALRTVAVTVRAKHVSIGEKVWLVFNSTVGGSSTTEATGPKEASRLAAKSSALRTRRA